jgi:cobalt-zinc-cadmium efflux system membrane fusion protein
MKSKKNLFNFIIVFVMVALSAVFYRLVQPANETQSKALFQQGQNGNEGHNDRKVDEEHEDANGHEKEGVVRLSKDEMKEFGIEVARAGPGKIQIHINLPGEVALNADRLAHVVPRVSGIAREVRKVLGDRVRKSEVMAVLESRELADTKAAFLAARERVALARANFIREERLWKGKISSEQEYLQTRQVFAEARVELQSAEQKLHALGFSEDFLEQLPKQPDISFTRYQITAPFDGTVIEKHIVLGEVIKDDAKVYLVADLSSVWVNISVYQKDLAVIRKGLPVVISAGHGIADATGTISYVGPLLGEKTRTALARVVLPNPEGQWRPGLFITASIAVNEVEVPLVVPKTALQDTDGKPTVFIKTEDGFSPEPVTIGRSNSRYAEITSGISLGQLYVKRGAFTLKAQLSKGAFGGGHAH